MKLTWADDLAETIEFGPNKFSTHYTMESNVGERTTFKAVIVDKQLTIYALLLTSCGKRNHSSEENVTIAMITLILLNTMD